MTRCAGNDTQYCGGAQTISLYRKCDAGSCKNNEIGVVGNVAVPASGAVPRSAALAGNASQASSSATGPASPASLSPPAASRNASSQSDRYVTSPEPDTAPSANASSIPASLSPLEGTSPISSSSLGASLPTGTSVSSNGATDNNNSSTVALPQGWRAVGCHVDPINPRALTHWAYWGEAITSSGCVKYCNGKSYSFAGTENRGQCFCGNKVEGGKGADVKECTSACRGDEKETCGGPGRLSLFTKATKTERRGAGHRHLRGGLAHKGGI